MTAPAVVTWAVQRNWVRPQSRRLRFLRNEKTALLVTVLAACELIVDKLPGTPNRTELPSLAARALSGGLSAAVLCASRRKHVLAGALLGAMAAVGGTYTGYGLRKRLDEKLAVDDKVIAVAEDLLASSAGVLLVRAA